VWVITVMRTFRPVSRKEELPNEITIRYLHARRRKV
jgi:hypothetical protein